MGVAIGHLKMSFFKILANVYIFFSKSIFKLFISQIRNMISGVNYGYFIDMFLKGIGYRL
jgi:ribosomal protein L6P/L9E